jgi:hypothetical protein
MAVQEQPINRPDGIWDPWNPDRVVVEVLSVSEGYGWGLAVPGQKRVLYISRDGETTTWMYQPEGYQPPETAIAFSGWDSWARETAAKAFARGPIHTILAIEHVPEEDRAAEIDRRVIAGVAPGAMWLWRYSKGRTAALEIGGYNSHGGRPYNVEIEEFLIPASGTQAVAPEYLPPGVNLRTMHFAGEEFIRLAERGELVPMTTGDRLPWIGH